MADPALVLLHPFPFDSRVFSGLQGELDLITPDLHGTGRPTLDVLADQVIAALDRAGRQQAIVGGVSMGGYVALNLLRRYRHRVAGLILIDSKAAGDGPAALVNREAMADRADRGLRPDAAETLRGMVSPLTLETRPDLLQVLATIIDDQPTSGIAWNQRAMAGRPDSSELVADIEQPVLIIAGADDTITPPAAARELAATARNGSFVAIPDAGHLAVAENPAAVAAAIRRYCVST